MPNNDLMGTLENVLRIFRIIQTNKHVTRQRLAEELGVHTKTIQRYLKTMDAAGFHLDADEHGHLKPRIAFHPETNAPPPLNLLTLNRDELTWLYLLLSGVHHAAPPGLREKLWNRIRNALEGEPLHGERLSSMMTTFAKGYKSYEKEDTRGLIARLLDAMYRERACNIEYGKPDGTVSRYQRVEPYQVFEYDGGMYCYCHQPPLPDVQERVFMLAVERMRHIELLDAGFTKRPDVLTEIEEKKSRAFRILDDSLPVSVKLRFKPNVAFYVQERVWHESQQLIPQADGGVIMVFTATGRVEIERWINSWGDDCEVIQIE